MTSLRKKGAAILPAAGDQTARHIAHDVWEAASFATGTTVAEIDLDAGEARNFSGAPMSPLMQRLAATFADIDAFARMTSVEDAREREAVLREALASNSGYRLRYNVQDSGENVYVYESGGVFERNGQRLIGVAFRVIDEEAQRSIRLAESAEQDELTCQLNRGAFCRRLADVIGGPAEEHTEAAYLLIAIDDLGGINAEFGFDAADEAIRGLSARIRASLAADDVIGRVAGNKFGVLVRHCGPDAIRERCADLMNAVRSDLVMTEAGPVSASISIGAAPLAPEINSAEVAMVRGEAALNHARRMGPSSWAVFTDKIDRASQRKRNAEVSDMILSALNERRITLAYQPIVADVNETPSHYECLIRMRDPDGQIVPAPDFIPAAERLGLVHLLDRRVLELATATLNGAPDIKVNVNVSWETIKDPVWVEGYLANLRANARVADRITVELTETQAIDAFDATIDFVSEIKELGCKFAIDDFGAGYTSFRNLKALDIDMLKIDGSFVSGVASSRENQLFVRTLLDLARNFEVRTVAEWVDNETDALMLKGLGVDYLQGFMIGVPEIDPVWAADAASVGRPRVDRRAPSSASIAI